MNKNSRAIQTGLAVLAAIAILYVLIAWGTNSGFWSQEEVEYGILFENVDGLLEGDPVDVRGYRSGRVTSILPSSEGVLVNILMNQKVVLREDARAELQVKEIMGGKQVSVFPGTSSGALTSGSTIPGKKALDFTSAFSKLGDGMDKLDFDRLNTVFYRLDTLSQRLTAAAGAVSPNQLQDLVLGLNQTTQGINRLVGGLNQANLPVKLDTALQEFGRLAQTADLALARFDLLAAKLDQQTLPQADTLMQELGYFLSKTEQTLESADGLFRQLKDTSTVVGKLLNDPAWATLVDTSLANLNKTLIHIRRHKVHVSLSLSPKKKTYKE